MENEKIYINQEAKPTKETHTGEKKKKKKKVFYKRQLKEILLTYPEFQQTQTGGGSPARGKASQRHGQPCVLNS